MSETSTIRLREEVAFWRKDAAARLWGAMADYRAAEEAGDQKRMIAIKVRDIDPTLYAFRDADAGHFHEGCEFCSAPLHHGQFVILYEDATVHADCDNPDQPASYGGAVPYDDMFTDERVAEIVAEAKALVEECD